MEKAEENLYTVVSTAQENSTRSLQLLLGGGNFGTCSRANYIFNEHTETTASEDDKLSRRAMASPALLLLRRLSISRFVVRFMSVCHSLPWATDT